jgi:hypothetical protein
VKRAALITSTEKRAGQGPHEGRTGAAKGPHEGRYNRKRLNRKRLVTEGNLSKAENSLPLARRISPSFNADSIPTDTEVT